MGAGADDSFSTRDCGCVDAPQWVERWNARDANCVDWPHSCQRILSRTSASAAAELADGADIVEHLSSSFCCQPASFARLGDAGCWDEILRVESRHVHGTEEEDIQDNTAEVPFLHNPRIAASLGKGREGGNQHAVAFVGAFGPYNPSEAGTAAFAAFAAFAPAVAAFVAAPSFAASGGCKRGRAVPAALAAAVAFAEPSDREETSHSGSPSLEAGEMAHWGSGSQDQAAAPS